MESVWGDQLIARCKAGQGQLLANSFHIPDCSDMYLLLDFSSEPFLNILLVPSLIIN